MTDVEYLLIGGGMASFHAAKQIRRSGAGGAILIVSEEDLPPYDRPPLSKELLRGEKTVGEIVYEDAAKLAEQKIDLSLGARVESLDLAAKSVRLANGESIGFEKALIATGGRPVRLRIPGADLEGVRYLRTAADSLNIAAAAGAGKRAVIVGGGFIGVESAASLTQRGALCTVIEALPHIWPRFCDATLAGFFQDYCGARGVTFLTNEKVTRIEGNGSVRAVVTESGRTLECDLVLIGVGIVPNVELAQAAGLEVNNGIVVDERMRTSHPDVFAAGDVINYPDVIFGNRRRVEHWGHAEYSGQVAGRNLAGGDARYEFLSYVWSDVFDLRLEFAGDEGEHDGTLIRGKPGAGPFTVLYLKDGALTAYFAVNADAREYGVFRRLIRAKKDMRGREAQLTDQSADPRALLA